MAASSEKKHRPKTQSWKVTSKPPLGPPRHEQTQTHTITDTAPRKLDANATRDDGQRRAPRAAPKDKLAVTDYSFADDGDKVVISLPLPQHLGDDRVALSHDEASLRVEIDDDETLRVLELPTRNGPFFRGITKVKTKRAGATLKLLVYQLIHDIQVIRQ